MRDCLNRKINEGDFVIYVVQGNRNPGIEFGWVDEIVDKTTHHVRPDGTTATREIYKVRLHRAKADGTRENILAVTERGHFSVPGDPASGYIPPVMHDTGKPSTTILQCCAVENRLLITKPFV